MSRTSVSNTFKTKTLFLKHHSIVERCLRCLQYLALPCTTVYTFCFAKLVKTPVFQVDFRYRVKVAFNNSKPVFKFVEKEREKATMI